MNILSFGVKIDPSGAESGSRAARAAMDKLRESQKDVQKAAGQASDSLAKTSDKGAFSKITGAASAAARAVTGAFSGMVRAVTGTVSGITKALGSIGLAIDGLRMLTAPLRGFLGDVIGNAADMETFRFQWAYILGSVDKAREKMASLQKFANETPFDLPGVTQAALMMADLKDAALAGEVGLKRIGDAAARANQPIQELASRIVRLSGNLERGAGGGDELRALTEWRIIRPAAAARIADLSTDAGNFQEAMKIVIGELDRSENAMKLMSVTWKGLTSTMADSWGALKTAIGEPLLEGLKPLLLDATKLIDAMTAQIKLWAPEIQNFGLEISAAFKVLTGVGGIQLTLTAAADYFIEQLKRGFIILGKMLSNIFDVVTYQFTQALKKLASKEFWVGVGEALVEGVGKALDALAFGAETSPITRAVQSVSGGPALTEPAAPQFLSPAAIEATVPFEETPAMLEWKRQQQNAKEDAMGVQEYLKYQIDSTIGSSGGGPAENFLFPMSGEQGIGAGIGETLAKMKSEQKELASDAERWGEAVQTPQEALDATLAKLEKMKGLGIEKGGLTDETYMRLVAKAHEDYAAAVESSSEKVTQALEKTTSAHSKLLQSWKDLGKNIDGATVQMSESITNNIASALTDLVTGTKSAKEAFASMASSIIKDIVSITMKLMVQYFYSQLLGMIPGTGGFLGFAKKAMGVSVMHDGGVVGGPGETRSVGSEIFTGAVRYHSGGNVGKNEVPAILERGETVLTKEQMSSVKRRLDGSGEAKGSGGNVTIINLSDPNAAQAELARTPGAILNVIGANLPKVREMILARSR